MARWYIVTSAIAMLLVVSAGAYFSLWAPSPWYRAAGPVMVLFGVASFADGLKSRIVLDDEELRIISLVRTRRYPRSDFVSAKAEGGGVGLKRKDGGWVVLPATGHSALSVRNAVHAWIQRAKEAKS